MSFEYNPADEDEHALCRHEIETLRAVNAELLAACEKAQELYRLHEILEYGCGGTSEELAAARRIEEINEQINQAVKKAKGST